MRGYPRDAGEDVINFSHNLCLSHRFLLLSGLLLITSPVMSIEPSSHRLEAIAIAANGVISKEKAASIARGVVTGKVVSVNLDKSSGKPIYKVRILQDGKVRNVKVDAISGDIL